MRQGLTNICQIFGAEKIGILRVESGAVQEYANIVDSNKTLQNEYLLEKSASIQPKSSPAEAVFLHFLTPQTLEPKDQGPRIAARASSRAWWPRQFRWSASAAVCQRVPPSFIQPRLSAKLKIMTFVPISMNIALKIMNFCAKLK